MSQKIHGKFPRPFLHNSPLYIARLITNPRFSLEASYSFRKVVGKLLCYSWPRSGSLTVPIYRTTGYQFWLICIRCMWFHIRIGQNGIGKIHCSCIGVIIIRSKTKVPVFPKLPQSVLIKVAPGVSLCLIIGRGNLHMRGRGKNCLKSAPEAFTRLEPWSRQRKAHWDEKKGGLSCFFWECKYWGTWSFCRPHLLVSHSYPILRATPVIHERNGLGENLPKPFGKFLLKFVITLRHT